MPSKMNNATFILAPCGQMYTTYVKIIIRKQRAFLTYSATSCLQCT